MSNVSDTPAFSEQEFDSIEAAVMETDRGRQFLIEFAQRNRVADTTTLLDAIKRLEQNLKPQISPAPVATADDDLHELGLAIQATSQDICAVRNDMLKETCAITDEQAVFSSLSNDASEISKALIATAEALQKSAADIRESSPDGAQVDGLDSNINELFENGWRQDVLAQRITKAMRLLTHLQQNLAEFSEDAETITSKAPEQAPHPELTDGNRQYFAQDEELFSAQMETTADTCANAEETVAPDPVVEPEPEADIAGNKPAEIAAGVEPVEPNIVVVRAGYKADENVEQAVEGAAAAPVEGATVQEELDDQTVPDTVEAPAETQSQDDVIQTFSEFADAATSPALDLPVEPQVELTPDGQEKERIVVIRKGASENFEIPFADYLGLDESKQEPASGS